MENNKTLIEPYICPEITYVFEFEKDKAQLTRTYNNGEIMDSVTFTQESMKQCRDFTKPISKDARDIIKIRLLTVLIDEEFALQELGIKKPQGF